MRSIINRIKQALGYQTSTHQRLQESEDDLEAQNNNNKNDDTRKHSHLHYMRILLPYLWPSGKPWLRVRVVTSLVLLVSSKLISVATPMAYKSAIDSLTDGTGVPLRAVFLYGAGRIGSTASSNLRDTVFVKVAQNALKSAGIETFAHLHRLSLQFHIKRRTGGILRAIDRGTRGINWLTSWTLFNIFPIFLEIGLVTLVLLANYHVLLALITLVTVVLYIGFTLGITEWRTRFRREMNKADNECNDKAVDALLNFETVKYFSAEQHEVERYSEAMNAYTSAQTRSQASLAALNIGQSVTIALGQLVVLLLTAYWVADGYLTVGDFVLVNTYLMQLYSPLGFLGSSYRMVKQSLVDMEKMFDLLEEDVEIADLSQADDLSIQSGRVEFKDVHFSYGESQVLKGVSFTVEPGTTCAIVGPSGAGKSTISKLLFRLYDIDSGSISIDGEDISHVTQSSVRRSVGIVPQDTVLFNDSIRYNIGYGKVGSGELAEDDEIEDAAKRAHIHDRILTFPDQYETRVGERGVRLSGGEKQRVAIARALLKNPRVMVFDEATSALDTTTEREIQDALREVFVGRTTTISLAHRLSTIVDADEIIVLKDGQVAERGKHEDLLALNGEYATLWKKQSTKQNQSTDDAQVEDVTDE